MYFSDHCVVKRWDYIDEVYHVSIAYVSEGETEHVMLDPHQHDILHTH